MDDESGDVDACWASFVLSLLLPMPVWVPMSGLHSP